MIKLAPKEVRAFFCEIYFISYFLHVILLKNGFKISILCRNKKYSTYFFQYDDFINIFSKKMTARQDAPAHFAYCG